MTKKEYTIQRSVMICITGLVGLFFVFQTAQVFAAELGADGLSPAQVNSDDSKVPSTSSLVSKATAPKVVEKIADKKTISGEIGARGPNGFALVYEKDDRKRTSREMWFPYESGELELVGYASKADIGEGDYVTVTYDEMPDKSKRTLTGIQLDRKYVPPLEGSEESQEK